MPFSQQALKVKINQELLFFDGKIFALIFDFSSALAQRRNKGKIDRYSHTTETPSLRESPVLSRTYRIN